MLRKRCTAAFSLSGAIDKSSGDSARDRKTRDAQDCGGVQCFSPDQKSEREQKDAKGKAADESGKQTRTAALPCRQSGSKSRQKADGGADIGQSLLSGVQKAEKERAEKDKRRRADRPGQYRAQEAAGSR